MPNTRRLTRSPQIHEHHLCFAATKSHFCPKARASSSAPLSHPAFIVLTAIIDRALALTEEEVVRQVDR